MLDFTQRFSIYAIEELKKNKAHGRTQHSVAMTVFRMIEGSLKWNQGAKVERKNMIISRTFQLKSK